MNQVSIELMQQEAERLVREQIKLLKKLKKSPNLLVENEGVEQTFTFQSIDVHIENLEDELYKLESLEVVLAIVGTMKSGKSTTINAIVGREILPNRNRPMTALPTLIRHTSGVIKPKLSFENIKPLNNLFEEIKNVFSLISKESIEIIKQDPDVVELIDQINEGIYFQTSYEGEEEIFSFLKKLNDLVRLTSSLGLSFPFSRYNRVENLPVIEVEFVHLKDMIQEHGQLTLLDTPGPNEAGQKHLRIMLNEQLEKASAVLAVLDYTQLKSDADNEIRENLESTASLSSDRLYVLVNKFDERNRNSDSAEKTRDYVANTLMKGKVSIDRIYPVSSNYAYLASQAKNEMLLNNQLPDYEEHEWVADFATEALHRMRWKEEVKDPNLVNEGIEGLWKESNFEGPLAQVIKKSHGGSAVIAIKSSLDKVLDLLGELNNFLGVKSQSFKKNFEDLKSQKDIIEKDLNEIIESESEIRKEINFLLNALKKNILKSKEEAELLVLNKLDDYFIKNSKSASNDEKDVLVFDSIELAKAKLELIKITIEQSFDDTERELSNLVISQVKKFNELFTENVKKSEEILKSIQGEMNDFKLSVKLPEIKPIKIDTSNINYFEDVRGKDTKYEISSRRKDGLWGWFCEKINTSDFGWETYRREIDVYSIDIGKIRDNIDKSVFKLFSDMEKSINENINLEVKKNVDDFYSVFKTKVEHVYGDLVSSLVDREKTEEEQEAIINNIAQLERVLPSLSKDADLLEADINRFVSKKEGSHV